MTPEQKYSPKIEFFPSLKAIVEEGGLKAEDLCMAMEDPVDKKTFTLERPAVPVSDAKTVVFWTAPPLRTMFRGTHPPPADISHYPPEYVDLFYLIESTVLAICDVRGERTDQELEEIFSYMRRRPDGKSMGRVHDFIWKAAAFMLGKYVVSEAEFDAIFGQLARSCRGWAERPVSRNYIAYLRHTLE